ncbi:hypothetical protein [Psychrobacter sp. CAL346-MNA-CIBAN-0220]|uniref:hypothetical protein n=1 Tax=Psychrobacter sp. CAL346-MNA-CIBAN-0220 TaxID=3140457 RepID=UPI00332E91F9
MKIKMIVAIAVIALLGIIGFKYYSSTQSKVSVVATEESLAKLNNITNRWEHNSEAVSKAPKAKLPAAIKDMQSLRREANKLGVTPCLTSAQNNLLVAMDSEIAGYLKLMADDDAVITTDINRVYQAITKYHEIVEKCAA